MTRSQVPNRMKLEKFKRDYEGLTPEERLLFHEEYGLTFKSRLDRVRDGFERLSDDDRVEFAAWEDDHYHAPCGQRLPEDEDDHDCPVDDEDDEDDDHADDEDDDEDDDDADDEDDDDEDGDDDDDEDESVDHPDENDAPDSKSPPSDDDSEVKEGEEDYGKGFDEK